VSSSETIARLIPNSELVIFEKSGHSPQFEEREEFQRVIRDFIDRAVPATVTA
jgi:proline iminopeptidase